MVGSKDGVDSVEIDILPGFGRGHGVRGFCLNSGESRLSCDVMDVD